MTPLDKSRTPKVAAALGGGAASAGSAVTGYALTVASEVEAAVKAGAGPR